MKSEMSPARLLIPISIGLLIGGMNAASAQDGGASVSMKINLVAWGDPIPGLKLKGKGKANETTALAFQYSKAISYTGPQVLEISQAAGAKLPPPPEREFDPEFDKPYSDDEKANQVEEAPGEVPKVIMARREKNPELVALAKLPANSRQVTVLLAPAGAGTYNTYVIDDDPRKLPMGTLRIHNLSKQVIAMRCNRQEKKQLKYREAMSVRPKGSQVIYELAYLKKGKWKMQESNLLRVSPDEQVQFIVLQSNAGFFVSSGGSRSGFLQTVALRRGAEDDEAAADSSR